MGYLLLQIGIPYLVVVVLVLAWCRGIKRADERAEEACRRREAERAKASVR
jgi:hypothetical protein